MFLRIRSRSESVTGTLCAGMKADGVCGTRISELCEGVLAAAAYASAGLDCAALVRGAALV
jgi:hypothetical protein